MTDGYMIFINKNKIRTRQTDPIVRIKPDSKNDLISSDSILLNEEVNGNIYCLKEVIVDKDGDVTGNIHSKSCIVTGKVNGNILSVDYIDIKNTAIIEGNIKAGSIQIEAGSIINGFISTDKKIKLPAITRKVTEELTERPDNSKDLKEEIPETVKIIPAEKLSEKPDYSNNLKGGIPEFLKNIPAEKPSENPDYSSVLQEEIDTTVSIHLEKEAEASEIIPEPAKISVEPDNKIEVIQESALKKDNTNSSNDSWW